MNINDLDEKLDKPTADLAHSISESYFDDLKNGDNESAYMKNGIALQLFSQAFAPVVESLEPDDEEEAMEAMVEAMLARADSPSGEYEAHMLEVVRRSVHIELSEPTQEEADRLGISLRVYRFMHRAITRLQERIKSL